MSLFQTPRTTRTPLLSNIPFPLSSKPSHFPKPHLTPFFFLFPKHRVSTSVSSPPPPNGRVSTSVSSPPPLNGGVTALRSSSDNGSNLTMVESDRPPFDLDLAVVLAGFAFEAYSGPPENAGWREVDAAECQTVFLSKSFLREVYDGKLFIKLKKGVNLPALDPWGTSDPYVVLQLNGRVAKSHVKWATKDPTWNEDITLNIKISQTNILQVAAWDANLVTPHKRMGNAGLNLDSLCDGNLHEIVVELEGIGGGGQIFLEVKYKSYDDINEEKNWWTIPFVSDILMKGSLGAALRVALGCESVNVSDFVQSAFGQLKPLYYSYLEKQPSSNSDKENREGSAKSLDTDTSSEKILQGTSTEKILQGTSMENFLQETSSESSVNNLIPLVESNSPNKSVSSDEHFWKTLADSINQSVLKKVGVCLPEIKVWEGFDLLNRMSLQSQKIAEVEYIQSGLATPAAGATPETKDGDDDVTSNQSSMLSTALSSILDIRKASWDVLNQTEAVLGAMVVLAANLPQQKKDTISQEENGKKGDDALLAESEDVSLSKETKDFETGNITVEAGEMRKIFSSAESAMEAWTMLATSLGRNSFIKSEFEKICFLDNASTDTQVAIWRDTRRRRMIIAFRGTEQTRWKDLCTDLMLVPAGLNPERLGGDFKQELQVHSGFLNAYDSVRNRIMALIKLSIGYSEDDLESMPKWHVYITGHSLGGALATLLALELSSSRMAKFGAISVTMYNFGSPRVGNKRFAEVYNEKVKDSWRVVNHRDIIPTVPRLMGYCHVAQPVYLGSKGLKESFANKELLGKDEYQGDIIGESTPDVLVSEFMKGEKQLVENILQTEINLLRSIRDGTALMQHMEDFYYIMLLESVRSNYNRVETPYSSEEGSSA